MVSSNGYMDHDPGMARRFGDVLLAGSILPGAFATLPMSNIRLKWLTNSRTQVRGFGVRAGAVDESNVQSERRSY